MKLGTKRLNWNDFKKIYPINSISYNQLWTSKTLLKDSPLHRYWGVLGISVDTKVQKSRLILKNDVS